MPPPHTIRWSRGIVTSFRTTDGKSISDASGHVSNPIPRAVEALPERAAVRADRLGPLGRAWLVVVLLDLDSSRSHHRRLTIVGHSVSAASPRSRRRSSSLRTFPLVLRGSASTYSRREGRYHCVIPWSQRYSRSSSRVTEGLVAGTITAQASSPPSAAG